jgi:hypothetical protein
MDFSLVEIVLNNSYGFGSAVLIYLLAYKHIDRNTQVLNKLNDCIIRIEGKLNGKN